jgi:hypothetical protein
MLYEYEVEAPLIAIIGNRGSCKTLFMTHIAVEEAKLGRKIFSNYHLMGIPYERYTYDMLEKLPEKMQDGIILMDEIQMGSDSYEFLSKKARSITTLITQMRKRNLTVYMTTQNFRMVTKRMRDLTDYIYVMENVKDQNNKIIKGMAKASLFDAKTSEYSNNALKKYIFDGRKYFKNYNTREIIK